MSFFVYCLLECELELLNLLFLSREELSFLLVSLFSYLMSFSLKRLSYNLFLGSFSSGRGYFGLEENSSLSRRSPSRFLSKLLE